VHASIYSEEKKGEGEASKNHLFEIRGKLFCMGGELKGKNVRPSKRKESTLGTFIASGVEVQFAQGERRSAKLYNRAPRERDDLNPSAV